MQVIKPNIFLIFLVTVVPGSSRESNDNTISDVTSHNPDHHVPLNQGLKKNQSLK